MSASRFAGVFMVLLLLAPSSIAVPVQHIIDPETLAHFADLGGNAIVVPPPVLCDPLIAQVPGLSDPSLVPNTSHLLETHVPQQPLSNGGCIRDCSH